MRKILCSVKSPDDHIWHGISIIYKGHVQKKKSIVSLCPNCPPNDQWNQVSFIPELFKMSNQKRLPTPKQKRMHEHTSFGRSRHTPHLRIALESLISSCSLCTAASPLAEVNSSTVLLNSTRSSSSFFFSLLDDKNHKIWNLGTHSRCIKTSYFVHEQEHSTRNACTAKFQHTAEPIGVNRLNQDNSKKSCAFSYD